MATSYTQLKADIPAWLQNESDELTAQLDRVIDLAEARLSRDLMIRAYDHVVTGNFVAGTETITRPADIIQPNYIRWQNASGTWTSLLKKQREWLFDYWPTPSDTGTPVYYGDLDNTNFLIAPTPDDTYAYEIGYRRRLPALSASNETNWLTDYAEDALLFACLVEASAFTIEPAQLQSFAGLYQNAVARVNNEFTRTLRDDLRTAPLAVTVQNDGAT